MILHKIDALIPCGVFIKEGSCGLFNEGWRIKKQLSAVFRLVKKMKKPADLLLVQYAANSENDITFEFFGYVCFVQAFPYMGKDFLLHGYLTGITDLLR